MNAKNLEKTTGFNDNFWCLDYEVETGIISEIARERQRRFKESGGDTRHKFPAYLKGVLKEDRNGVYPVPLMLKMTGNGKSVHTTNSFLEMANKILVALSHDPARPTEFIFHNLGYDFSFIIPELLHSGYKNVVEVSEKIEYRNKNGETILHEHLVDKLAPKQFKIVGSSQRDARYVDINFRGRYIRLVDSFQFYPSSLKSMGKTFGVETLKDDYDWTTHVINTNYNEIDAYADKDVISLKECVTNYRKRFTPKGYTCASIATNIFKATLDFKSHFPQLGEQERILSHKTYNGGVSYVNPTYLGKEHKNVVAIDINSQYPSVMKKEKFPIGLPEKSENMVDDGRYNEAVVRIKFKLKANKVPYIRVNSTNHLSLLHDPKNLKKYKAGEFPKKFEGVIALNSIDYETMLNDYDVEIQEVIDCNSYKTAQVFEKFVETWYNKRREFTDNGDEGGRFFAKIILNSLYGKFGQNLSGDVILAHSEGNRTIISEDLEGVYTPVASAVTAYARRALMEVVNLVGARNFYYCDTDSAYIKSNALKLVSVFLDDAELGKWGVDRYKDGTVIKYHAKFLGKKTYMLVNKYGIQTTKCVGLNVNVANSIPFDKFERGYETKTTKGRLTKYGIIIDNNVPYFIRGVTYDEN